MILTDAELVLVAEAARKVPDLSKDDFFKFVADRLRPLPDRRVEDIKGAVGDALRKFRVFA